MRRKETKRWKKTRKTEQDKLKGSYRENKCGKENEDNRKRTSKGIRERGGMVRKTKREQEEK